MIFSDGCSLKYDYFYTSLKNCYQLLFLTIKIEKCFTQCFKVQLRLAFYLETVKSILIVAEINHHVQFAEINCLCVMKKIHNATVLQSNVT